MMATPQGTLDPETATQDAAMPTADQQTTQSVTPVDTAQATSAGKDEQGLPDEASERTRREFEKFRTELREERERRQYLESVINSMNTPDPTPQIPSVYDHETGLVNTDVLTAVQKQAIEAEERARRAEAAVSNYLYQQEEREAYTAHPELKDETFRAQAEGIMYHSQVNPDKYGKQFSINDAASYLKGILKPMTDQAKADAQKEAIEQITPKEQASLEADGGRAPISSDDEVYEELRYRSRRGDQDALAMRLHKIPPSRE